MVVAEHFHGTHEPRGLPIAGPVLQDVGLRDVRDVGDVEARDVRDVKVCVKTCRYKLWSLQCPSVGTA